MAELVPLLVPAELAGHVQEVVGVMERFRSEAAARTEDFEQAEHELAECVSALECASLAQMLGALDEDAERVEANGEVWRRLDPPYEETYASLRGPVRISRHLYRQTGRRNGATMVPVELRAGIVAGRYTPAAAVGLAHLNQAMPSREADEVARSLGVLPYSRSAQHRGGTVMGERWAELEQHAADTLIADLDIPKAACSLALSVDRVSMPMAEDRPLTASDIKRGVKKPISVEFRMAYAACWTLCDAQGRALMCVRYAHVPEGGADAMEQRLRTDLAVLHHRRPDLLICTLADGAPEMQTILDRVVEGYEVRARMVDFWHLSEYLGSAAASMGREVASTLARHKGYLLAYDSGADAVLTELLAWQSEAGPTGPPEALAKAIIYVTNQKSRLRYASAYHAGLPIGSGHVEATAKTIFETRMKRTGARWRPEGGQALLGLRALATSSPDRWRAGMREVLSTFRATVVPTDRRR